MATLTAEQLKRVEADFKERDPNKDGKLTVAEYSEALKPWYSPAELEQHLKTVNTNGDGEISYQEFLDEYIRDLDS